MTRMDANEDGFDYTLVTDNDHRKSIIKQVQRVYRMIMLLNQFSQRMDDALNQIEVLFDDQALFEMWYEQAITPSLSHIRIGRKQ